MDGWMDGRMDGWRSRHIGQTDKYTYTIIQVEHWINNHNYTKLRNTISLPFCLCKQTRLHSHLLGTFVNHFGKVSSREETCRMNKTKICSGYSGSCAVDIVPTCFLYTHTHTHMYITLLKTAVPHNMYNYSRNIITSNFRYIDIHIIIPIPMFVCTYIYIYIFMKSRIPRLPNPKDPATAERRHALQSSSLA